MVRVVIKGTPEIHRKFFAEFCHFERLGGGPDPHMKLAVWLARDVEDPAWWYGCYIGPYVVATGEFIHSRWPTAKQVLREEPVFRRWIRENYPKFEMRRERRAIYGHRRFSDHMVGYARWCEAGIPEFDDFEAAWEHVCTVPGNGRYGSTKLYEVLRRGGLLKHPFPDIRPKGGQSPRIALAWLRPEEQEVLCKGDNPKTLARVNEIAAEERARLLQDHDIGLDWFEFEVLLCEYKQAYDGHQYPGRAHDSELGRARKVQAKTGMGLRLWEGRLQLFPHEPLGEVGDRWSGRRDLGGLVLNHGYTWSDMLYDYARTTDLSQPVRRDAP